jgi:hypothetical protein
VDKETRASLLKIDDVEKAYLKCKEETLKKEEEKK